MRMTRGLLAPGPFLFTERGYANLKMRLETMNREHRGLLRSYADTPGCFQRGDTNSELAELERLGECLEAQENVIRHYLANGVIAEPPRNGKLLVLGVIATLEDEHGTKKDWFIAGHEETDTRSVPNCLAYSSPMLDGLYGRPAGTCNRWVDVLRIRVPRIVPLLAAVAA